MAQKQRHRSQTKRSRAGRGINPQGNRGHQGNQTYQEPVQMSEQQQLPLEPSVDLSLVGKMARFYREGNENLGPVVAKSMRMLQNGYVKRLETQEKSVDYTDLPRRAPKTRRRRSPSKPQRSVWEIRLDRYPFDQYTSREVGEYFGIIPSRVSQGLGRLEVKGILRIVRQEGNSYVYERAEK